VATVIDDPFLSYYGHPVLPCGYNSAPMSGDEFNGAGFNERVSPMLYSTFIGFEILIITEEMLEVFEGCADYTVPCENTVFMIPDTVREVVVR
jgi:hypothetical protein